MDIASHRQRARSISRGGRRPTFRNLASSGDIRLESANISPTQVSPGGRIEVTLTLRETAEFVTPIDPARCSTGNITQPVGLIAEVEVNPDWTSASDTSVCIPAANISAIREEITMDFVAPNIPGNTQSETHSINISVQQPGLEAAHHTATVEVTHDGLDQPPDDDDQDEEDSDSGTPWLPCIVDPFRSCGSTTDAGMQAALILVILVLAVAG